ncbi:hypothetical protein ACFSR7_06115 [Cohnella sp. GCM10020058]|uniref:glycoside hydrolase family 78 protein n=1 Tax=Cohnella sp. GCM10020058 TaxID=3317330 RepID=UPI00363D9CB3
MKRLNFWTKCISIFLLFILAIEGIASFPFPFGRASAAQTILVTYKGSYTPGYYWCQHLNGDWSTFSSLDGTIKRGNDGGQPKLTSDKVRTYANISVPSNATWSDGVSKTPDVSDIQPIKIDMQQAVKDKLQADPFIYNNKVVISGLSGKGMPNGSVDNTACGSSPGYVYEFPVQVTWQGKITKVDDEKFVNLEIDPTYKILNVGQTQSYAVFANYTVNGTPKKYGVTNDKLKWTSNQDSNVSVSTSGVATGKVATTTDATITAEFVGSGLAKGAKVTTKVKVIKPSANEPTADFSITPSSSITYGDSFSLEPNVTIPAACTFTSFTYTIKQGSLSYTSETVTVKTKVLTYTKATYPALIKAGASHSITMAVKTSCGNADAGPKTLYVGEEGSTTTPTPTPPGGGGPTPQPNNPPHVDVAWYDPATMEPVGMVELNKTTNLRATNMTDPDGDPVHIVNWDWDKSTQWLKDLPANRPITGIAPGYDGIIMNGEGLHTVYITVADSKGAEYTASASIGVVDPKPVAVITGTSRIKQNRVLPNPLSGANSYSPIGKAIVGYTWTNKADKYPNVGVETVTLKVKDEDGRESNLTTFDVTVIEDLPPVDTLIVPAEATRLDSVKIQSAAYSPDGDEIVSHKIEMKYDANNNGFADDSWSVVVNGAADAYTFTPAVVGKYLFRETTCEDYGKCGNTDGQDESERILDVKNLPPEVNVETSSPVIDPDNKTPISLANLYNNGSYYSLATRSTTPKDSWLYQSGILKTKVYDKYDGLSSDAGTVSTLPISQDSWSSNPNYNWGVREPYDWTNSPYMSFNNGSFSSEFLTGALDNYGDTGVNFQHNSTNAPIVDKDSIYIRQTDMSYDSSNYPVFTTNVKAYDKKTRALKWATTLPGSASPDGNMILINKKVYMVSQIYSVGASQTRLSVTLHTLNVETGAIEKAVNLTTSKGSFDGSVYMYSLPNGLFINIMGTLTGTPNQGHRVSLMYDLNGTKINEIWDSFGIYGYSEKANVFLMSDWTNNDVVGIDTRTYLEKYRIPYTSFTNMASQRRTLGIDSNGVLHMLVYSVYQSQYSWMQFVKINLATGAILSKVDVATPDITTYGCTDYSGNCIGSYASSRNGMFYPLGMDKNGNYLFSFQDQNNQAIVAYNQSGAIAKQFGAFPNPSSTWNQYSFDTSTLTDSRYPRLMKAFVGADGRITVVGDAVAGNYGYRVLTLVMDENLNVVNRRIDSQLYEVGYGSSIHPFILPFDDQTLMIAHRNVENRTNKSFIELLKTTGSPVGTKKYDVGSPSNDLILGDNYDTDATIEGDVVFTVTDTKSAGYVFRAQNQSNYYSVEFDNGQLKVNKTVNGTETNLFVKGYPINLNSAYKVKLVPKSGGFDIYVNKLYQTTINETAWKSGKFGIINKGRSGVSFSNASYYVTGENAGRISGVVLVDQVIDYTVSFTDPENDPRFTTDESWYYTHNPNTLINAGPNWGKDNQKQSSSIPAFSIPGDYTFKFKSKDDPNGALFAGYRQESNEFTGTIRVHRYPFAIFSITVNGDNTVNITDNSYDPDRYNPSNGQISTENTGINYAANHGIIDRKWKYRLVQSTAYVEGKPTRLAMAGTYEVALSVVDEYGAWSDWETQTVTVNGVTAQPPVAGFTVSTPTTYRFTTVVINSTAYDPQDGARENIQHGYYVKNLSTGAPESLQSDSRTSWEKEFSSLGLFQIRQIVVNSYALSAEATQNVNVINRKPNVSITDPVSTNPAAPDLYRTLRPTIKWSYSDGDGDVQQQYQLNFYKSDGSFYRDSGVQNGSPANWTPTADFADNTSYYVYVRVSDGMDGADWWSNWSTPHYFRVETNKPPTGSFTWTPQPVYEDDTVTIQPTVNDPDKDVLDVSFAVTSPSGAVQNYTYAWSYPYPTTGPVFKVPTVGDYNVVMTVSDRKAPAVTVQNVIKVNDLWIQGAVTHTERYEEFRKSYNLKATGDLNSPRAPSWFVAGETFVLGAKTTDTGTAVTKAKQVHVSRSPFDFAVLLASKTKLDWSGKMIDDNNNTKLKDGDYTFTFTATWTNGHTESVNVIIHVEGDYRIFLNTSRQETNS